MKIYNFLFEAEGASIDTPESSMKVTSSGTKARKALDSLDDQIDALILKYEASSITEESTENLAESSINKRNLKYLLEQEEEEEEEEEAEEEVNAEPTGSEKMTVKEPAQDDLIPNLDIDAFAGRTVRLINNYKSLLRIEEAIINRIKHFLDENYGDKFVQRYIEVLDSQYGVSLEEFSNERNTKDEPFAVGAFAGGTGQMGGAG